MHGDNRRIAYYITPHGYGHAVRSLEVIRNMMAFDPALDVIIVSDLPGFLIEQNLDRPVTMRKKRLDIGLVQQDSLRFDLDATLRALKDLHRNRREIIAEEVDFLSRHRVEGLVSDIPFLPFHASWECGIANVGLGNFTWDWIYRAYSVNDSRWRPLVEWVKEGYGRCDLFLRLPMHGDCSACPVIQDVPLIARKAAHGREEVRKLLGVGPDQKAYLVSFYSLHLEQNALAQIEKIENAIFLYKHPINYPLKNGRSLDGLNISYADAVGAVDGVITKPGYGIAADCLAHGTPMIYADRGFFPEYEILVRELEQHLNAVYIASEDLYAGRWMSALRCLENQPRRYPDCRVDGAEVSGREILHALFPPTRRSDEDILVMPIEESLDLHTFQPGEVRSLLEDYLEAAWQKGFREVRIIHGKGRGVLRKIVHSELARHSLVASFREAESDAGGWGATKVVLVDDGGRVLHTT